jgi:flagellar biosynthetic protein FliO
MDVLQTISGIALVFGLLALFYWVAHRLNSQGRLGGCRGRIQVVERMSLGDKKFLFLVRVAEETILIGATPHTISVLAPVNPEPREEEEGEEEVGSTSDRPLLPSFKALMGILR